MKSYKKFIVGNIRLFSLGLRFLLHFFLVKFLSLVDYGVFALTIVSSSMLVFFIGFEFYTFTMRRITSNLKVYFSKFQEQHNLFIIISFVLVLPISIWVYLFFVSEKNIFLFIIFLLLEVNLTESYRLLVAINELFIANISFLIRNGLASISIVLFGFLYGSLTLEFIFFQLILFDIISLLYIYNKKFLFYTVSCKKKWQIIGIKQSKKFFFIGVIAILIINTPYYIVKYFSNSNDFGIYSFFKTSSNALNIVVYSLITAIYLPIYLRTRDNKDYNTIRNKTILYSFSFAFLILVFLYFFLIITNKDAFILNYEVFILLVCGQTFVSLTTIFSTYFYVNNFDNELVLINLFMLTTTLLFQLVFTNLSGIWGSGFAYLCSGLLNFSIFFIYKYNKSKSI